MKTSIPLYQRDSPDKTLGLLKDKEPVVHSRKLLVDISSISLTDFYLKCEDIFLETKPESLSYDKKDTRSLLEKIRKEEPDATILPDRMVFLYLKKFKIGAVTLLERKKHYTSYFAEKTKQIIQVMSHLQGVYIYETLEEYTLR